MAAIERFGVTNDTVTVLAPASVGIPCTESDVCDIATELAFNHHITTVNFSDVRIGVEAAAALGRAFGPEGRGIAQYVKLSNCSMTAEAMEAFTTHARGNHRIEILDVSNNSLRDEGALHLAKFVESLPSLRVLEAGECKIGPLGASALGGCISTHRRLTTLHLSNNKLREAGATSIAKGLTQNNSISIVDLSGNAINREGGLAIADMLRKNKTIESLNVRNNFLSDSVPQIALALSQRGIPARVVDLSRNRVTNDICRAMSQVLEGQKFNIACLAVEGNPLGDDGLVALFHALRDTNIQFLDLSNCSLTPSSGVVLADTIRACPILNSFQMDNNKLGDGAIVEVATAFAQSAAMASLNLERTEMTAVGCAAITNAIRQQRKLRSINIAENHALKLEDVLLLLDAIATLRTVEHIDISDLNLEDSENLLRSLIAVFAVNEHLEKIVVLHNPMAGGFPDGVMNRRFALQLADGASLQSFLAHSTGQVTLNSSNSNVSAINKTTGGNRSVGLNETVASTFRPAWATIRPMEHKTSVVAVHSDSVDDGVEDGRVPPLIPTAHSLHNPMYPGYGIGRLSAGNHITTLSNTIPYTFDNTRGQKVPWMPAGDQSAQLQFPPRRALKQSPYSLMSLELNVGGLLITDDQLKRKFKELDVDGRGYLDRSEFRAAYLSYQAYGMPPSERELDELMKKHDVGHGNKLYFDEFAILMLKLAQR